MGGAGFRPDAAVPRAGVVYLVGAGPGAADLLTLRAYRLLRGAGVVVHDRLVSAEILALAPADALRIDVGKSPARHCLPQAGINALLVRLAREGRDVVRLKGGDPFVFGRGGEELAALSAAGIACEVVPGVTAALACAAQAGIPLTYRGVARAVTLVTGHTRGGELDIDFDAFSRPGVTLAVYMGCATLPRLRAGLLAHGLSRDTPAALVERGGTARQRTLRGTLETVVDAAPAWVTDGPVLALVGAAVGLATPDLAHAVAAAG
jgi:uroporphyrin-III C-methyltransferase/precorrin-2 dehydrogenase/sirohydrochlorin ferrochelatase